MATERRAAVQGGVIVNVAEVTTGAVPAFMADWPVVTEAGIGWTWDGDGFLPPVVVVTAAMVAIERDRRLALDFAFNGVLFQRDPVSITRISGAGVMALGAMVAGAQPGNLRWHGGADDFAWIASDNSLVTMDAQTCFAFGQAAAAVETRLIFKAKALRTMDPIPVDYTDDVRWT